MASSMKNPRSIVLLIFDKFFRGIYSLTYFTYIVYNFCMEIIIQRHSQENATMVGLLSDGIRYNKGPNHKD